jgi:hypothetical protein
MNGEAVERSNEDIILFMGGDGTYWGSGLQSLIELYLNDRSYLVVGSSALVRREKGSFKTFNSKGNMAIDFAMKSSISDALSGYWTLYRRTFNDLIPFGDNIEIEGERTIALIKVYQIYIIIISNQRRVEERYGYKA